MNRYWDLSEKQRSELTYDQVEAMLAVELMEKGVTKVDPPVLLPVEFAEVATQQFYTLKRSYHQNCIGWPTPEAAARALEGAVYFENEYIGSKRMTYPVSDEIEVGSIAVCTRADLIATKAQNEKAAANQKSNETAKKEFDESCKAVAAATSGVWEDYRECIDKAGKLKKIVDTFKNYCELCGGDLDIASRFLAKAFRRTDIAEAAEWHGIAIPDSESPKPAESECVAAASL